LPTRRESRNTDFRMRIALFLEALGRINSGVPILLLCRDDVEDGATSNTDLERLVDKADELDKSVLDLLSPNESLNDIVHTFNFAINLYICDLLPCPNLSQVS
jgi:hypothetical protein